MDIEFAQQLTINILEEFRELNCRKCARIENGLAMVDIPDWQRRELEDIQAMIESSPSISHSRVLSH